MYHIPCIIDHALYIALCCIVVRYMAESYYESNLDIEAIQAVFNNQLDDFIIKKLNPDLSLADLK